MGVKKSKFTNTMKDRIISQMIISELGTNAQYYKNSGINLNEIYNLGIYQYPDRWHLEDHIIADYNGIPYEMCDAVPILNTLQEELLKLISKEILILP